jgi:phosphoglycolate phosphatase
MAEQFELIVFDWDGTLMDSAARIVASLQAAGSDLNLPDRSDAQCRNIIGLGLKEAIHTLYQDFDPQLLTQFTDRYRHHFLVASPQPESLFEGVHEILQALERRRLWLGVATGKSRKGLDRALQQTDCRRYFHSTRCADETCSKPDPMMLREIMSDLGVAPERTLMVGDTEYDLEMAQRAGTAALAVSYGAHEIERLESYQTLGCMSSVTEMAQWLSDNV